MSACCRSRSRDNRIPCSRSCMCFILFSTRHKLLLRLHYGMHPTPFGRPSMPSHQARNFGFFHKEQSDCASEQYETQNLEAIAIGEQKCLTLDRAAGSTDRAQVSRIRIAAVRGEVR